uniref:Isopentenyl-diphosphate delta-isomerase n=1 Tax=uncultured euryarchaeote Alv-FOS4 TaxID=337893 RepID=Q3SA95_9EURY|nr:isopentenyl-diphosphate delta-isomerase FMN-dependent [uncultured euryarchaeote Alv-FOS4]
MNEQIKDRKLEHIKLCLDKNVNASYNYWDDVILKHVTIPRVDLEDIDLRVEFLGRKLEYPIIVDAMTGGHPVAKSINENIAKAAEELGIGMAVGSQRSAIVAPELEETYGVIRNYDVPLRLGNLGAPQFALGYGESEIEKAMEMVDAHALEIHFNYLQEAVQPEGDRVVSGLLSRLSPLARKYPLVAKETGAGFDLHSAKTLADMGFRAIDVSGVSGTSFAAVEYYRGGELGRIFWDWGLPSPYCLIELRELNVPLIGSGGLRNGLDAARALALGATVAGFARAILPHATKSAEAVQKKIEEIVQEMRVAMFLSGATSVGDMKNAECVFRGEMRAWL